MRGAATAVSPSTPVGSAPARGVRRKLDDGAAIGSDSLDAAVNEDGNMGRGGRPAQKKKGSEGKGNRKGKGGENFQVGKDKGKHWGMANHWLHTGKGYAAEPFMMDPNLISFDSTFAQDSGLHYLIYCIIMFDILYHNH